MGDAIGNMLPSAIGVAISPVPIVAVVLMLVTPNGKTNGLAFVLGWFAGIAVVGIIALLLASGADASETGQPATWVSVLLLLLGIALLVMAGKQWQSRNQAQEAPAWMKTLDQFTPVKAAGFAALLAGVNPKNLLLIVSGAAAISETGISAGDQAIALIVFILIASLGVLLPVAISVLMGERSASILEDLKSWLESNNATIMTVLLLVIGVKLVGSAIAGF